MLPLLLVLLLAGQTAETLNNRGNRLLAAGDRAGAEAQFRKALELEPENAQAKLQLTRIYFTAGLEAAKAKKYEEAEASFSKALERTPAEFEILYNLGLASLRAGHAQRAREALEGARVQKPGDGDVLIQLAAAYGGMKRNDLALAVLAQGTRLAPGRADIFRALARKAQELKYYGDAAVVWTKYLKLVPGDEEARREQAYMTALGGDAAVGTAGLRAWVARHPGEAVGYYELGVAEGRIDREDALKQVSKAVEMSPEMLEARFARAVLLIELGRAEEAVRELKVVLAREPENAAALDRLGMAYLALERGEEAVEVLKRAAERGTQDSRVYFHLSKAYARAGRREEARAMAEKFRELGPRRKVKTGYVEFLSLPVEEQRARWEERVEAAGEEEGELVE